jgi:hypothetical protein
VKRQNGQPQQKIQLSPLKSGLLKKLTVVHLVKEFPVSFGTRMFVAVITRAHHWSVPNHTNAVSTHVISCSFEIQFHRLSFHLLSCRLSDFILLYFRTVTLYLLIFVPWLLHSLPPLWSSGQSSWLQIQKSGFDSLRYQMFREVMGLERGPLSLVSTIEKLLGRKSSGSGLENRKYGHRDPSRWPRDTLYSQKWALTSPTSGVR